MNNPKNEKRAGIYIRVSTEHQLDKNSLKTQEERLSTYSQQMGYRITKVYRDAGLSAKDTNRPGLVELMEDIKAGQINFVLVTKLDRITRSLRDLFQLMDFFNTNEVNFVSLSESIDTKTAMGRFFFQLLGLLAQLEREVTAERVATDMRHRAEKGRWTGGIVPYGYMTQSLAYKIYKKQGLNEKEASKNSVQDCPEAKKLYIEPNTAKTVKWIFDKYIEFNSVRKVGTLLNSKGIKTRNGQLWPQTTIHRMLRSPTYIGKTNYGKRKTDPISGKLVKQDESTWTIVDAEHEAIISKDIYNKVQKMLSVNSKKPTKPGRTYLLTGLIKCGLCGRSMSGYTFTKKETGKSYSYYKCWNRMQKGKIACDGLSLPTNALETFIVGQLKEISHNHDFLTDRKKILESIKAKLKDIDSQNDIDQLSKNIVDLKRKLNVLMDKLQDGLIEDEDFSPRYTKIKADINVLEDEKARLCVLIQNKQSALDNLNASFDEISSFGSNWDFLDDVGKSMRIKSIIKEIRATKENVELNLYLDVVNPSHTGTGSWQPPA